MGLFSKKSKGPLVTAIVLAAGSGKRMDGIDKMLALICGLPVLVHSLIAFEEHKEIDQIVLVAKEEDIPTYMKLAKEHRINKLVSIVKGGQTRQQSVLAGVQQVGEETEYLCIHDGARPLVSREVISCCLDDAVQFGSAAAGVSVKDTIKYVDEDGFITMTPDRSMLYSMQTPQIFERELYLRAIKSADRDYTDDCQLIEAIGGRVYLSQGDYQNIKITTPEDLAVAEAILMMGEGQ